MEQWIIPPVMRPQAVVFDMDGLMVDTERVIKYTWDVTGERMGYQNFGDNILHTLGKNREQRNEYFRRTYGEDFPLQEFLDGYHQVYAQYEQEHGIPKKKGLTQLLETLRKMEIPMGVATSTHGEHAVPELKRQGVLEYFQAVITGDQVTKGKPDPEIYAMACRKLKAEPDQSLALEDSYNGIRSAAAAGMKVIMIPDLLRDERPVADCLFGKMKSLEQVASWLCH